MPALLAAESRKRLTSAAATLLFHLLLGYAFLTGLGFEAGNRGERPLKLIEITTPDPDTPRPEPPERSPKADARQAAAAPAGRRAEASQIVAPAPQIELLRPPPLAAAREPGSGSDSRQGRAEVGSGAGSGGLGEGGGSGSGRGQGLVTRARQIAGALSGRDYPRAAKRVRASGTVLVRYTVEIDGRVTNCTITQSSGNQDLDSTTCRLIEQRFRYEPARDAEGRAVADELNGRHIWWTEPRRRQYPYEWQPEKPLLD